MSTAEDLARWSLALHAGRVVTPSSLQLMTTPVKTADGKETPYGFGLGFRESQGHRLVGHDGAINGFVCQVEADPAAHTAVVILCNSDQQEGRAFLSRRLLALAAGTPIVEATGIQVAEDKLLRLVGSYQHDGFIRTISFTDGSLQSELSSGPAFQLVPTSETTFVLKGTDTTLRFEIAGATVVGVHRQVVGGAEESLAKRVTTEAMA